MRRWILLFVAGLIGLPLLLRVIALDDSFVVFVFGQTTVEMPLWFVVAAMVLLALVGYYGARFLAAVIFTPRRISRWMSRRNQRKVQDLTLRGYLSLLEGSWSAASRDLQKAADKSDSAVLNYLLAAKAKMKIAISLGQKVCCARRKRRCQKRARRSVFTKRNCCNKLACQKKRTRY
ncbi:MAG: heme biosynthesis HemY N-terminal domain-containing protein [Pseudomonadales bacterium]